MISFPSSPRMRRTTPLKVLGRRNGSDRTLYAYHVGTEHTSQNGHEWLLWAWALTRRNCLWVGSEKK